MAGKTKEQISCNMSRVHCRDTALENALCAELDRHGLKTCTRNDKSVMGKHDVVFYARKVAVFCDGEFWHGYDWGNVKSEIKSNRDFWIPKIEKNTERVKKLTIFYNLRDGGCLGYGEAVSKQMSLRV